VLAAIGWLQALDVLQLVGVALASYIAGQGIYPIATGCDSSGSFIGNLPSESNEAYTAALSVAQTDATMPFKAVSVFVNHHGVKFFNYGSINWQRLLPAVLS
jgi:hypothetical protein